MYIFLLNEKNSHYNSMRCMIELSLFYVLFKKNNNNKVEVMHLIVILKVFIELKF